MKDLSISSVIIIVFCTVLTIVMMVQVNYLTDDNMMLYQELHRAEHEIKNKTYELNRCLIIVGFIDETVK